MRSLTFLWVLALPTIAISQGETRPETPVVEQPARQEKQPRASEVIVDQLGLKFAVWSSKIRRRIISTRTPYGFAIARVNAGSLAKAAGLQRSTVVLEVNSKPFRQLEELAAVLRQAKPGDALLLKCARRRTEKERGPGRGRWIEFEVELKLPEPAKPPAKGKKGILV